jgi:hypothetical protein
VVSGSHENREADMLLIDRKHPQRRHQSRPRQRRCKRAERSGEPLRMTERRVPRVSAPRRPFRLDPSLSTGSPVGTPIRGVSRNCLAFSGCHIATQGCSTAPRWG